MNKVLTIILASLLSIALVLLLIAHLQLDSRDGDISELNSQIDEYGVLVQNVCSGSRFSSVGMENLVNHGYQVSKEEIKGFYLFHIIKKSGEVTREFLIKTDTMQVIKEIKFVKPIED